MSCKSQSSGSVVAAHGLIVLWHEEHSQTREATPVPCIVRQILVRCATREALIPSLDLGFDLTLPLT